MAGFEYRNAEDVRDAFKRHGVKYLFFGKSGAILLGFSDTTQDVDVFVEKHAANCEQLATALSDLTLTTSSQARKPRIGARIKSRCHACCLSARG
jgi:hypothetical protein